MDVNVPVVAVVFTFVEEIVILLPFLSTEYPLMPKSKSDKTPLLSDNVVSNKRFVRYSEGAEMYSMSVSKFMQLAKDAKACYKVNQLVLVNLDIIDEYLETFHIVDDEFYK